MTSEDFGRLHSSANTPTLTSYDVDLERGHIVVCDDKLLEFRVHIPWW